MATYTIKQSNEIKFFLMRPARPKVGLVTHEGVNRWALPSPEIENSLPKALQKFPWKEKGAPPMLLLSKHGTEWSDFLSCAGNIGHLVFSERIAESISANKLTGMEMTELDIDPRQNQKVKKPAWNYYEGIPVGKFIKNYFKAYQEIATANKKASHAVFHEICDSDDFDEVRKHNGVIQILPIISTWDGNDFTVRSSWDNNLIYCTRKVVETAHKEQWTNISFVPVDCTSCISMKNDFRENTWPPETWYPKAHPPTRLYAE